jgi:cyclopropane fatty-acyl-phospholipid synthase-like methyltransferase
MRDGNKKNIQSTIQYYDKYAKKFIGSTVEVDFTETQKRFSAKLRSGSHILDLGCGSGRDTKFFLEHKYQVTATDGSVELCKLASEYIGIEVKHMMFQELAEREIYDGIWACSSILHLPLPELEDVLHRMAIALKRDGIIYTSFKYGTYQGERNGRYFTDMTEETFSNLLQNIKELKIEDQWITSDVRPGRGDEKWLNIILRKS